jgi:hypothetical protein
LEKGFLAAAGESHEKVDIEMDGGEALTGL